MDHAAFLLRELWELSEGIRPLLGNLDCILLLLLRVDNVSGILTTANQLLEIGWVDGSKNREEILSITSASLRIIVRKILLHVS